MTRYAILIAVEDYDHFSTTRFCHADAQALRSSLVDECDYATQHVFMQLLSPTDTIDPPTLLAEVKKLAQSAKRGDTVLFFYAGHGHLHANETYLLLPHTEPGRWAQTALPMRDVADLLRMNERLNIRIIDACHSGLDVRDSTEKLDAQGFARAIIEESQQGWITLAACAEDEYSYADSSIGNGIFTRSLCEAILESKPGLLHPELLKIAIGASTSRKRSTRASTAMPLAFVQRDIENVGRFCARFAAIPDPRVVALDGPGAVIV